jgi:hypothetical protein
MKTKIEFRDILAFPLIYLLFILAKVIIKIGGRFTALQMMKIFGVTLSEGLNQK